MPDVPAIRLGHVSKIYRLYGSQRDQLIDLLGLSSTRLFRRKPAKEFKALDDISLVVPRGHRVGVIGRNGAGKTTLLKLISGNFLPTKGDVSVRGSVQALLGVGLGFHPEFSGLENAKSSLQYNGLSRNDYDAALEDIIEFCELGDFLDQPFKTYSLGMQARLMFASATAVRPDILIVDEVLGAGDAYFVAKSKKRIERLVDTGCTMLLVSHSTQQVLELCRDAIWLDQGRIRMQGDAFSIVKAYEEYIHGVIPQEQIDEAVADADSANASTVGDGGPAGQFQHHSLGRADGVLMQVPGFVPHSETPQLPSVPFTDSNEFRFEAPGGVSRWGGNSPLIVTGFSIVSERGVGDVLLAMRPAVFVIFLGSENGGDFNCRYGIALHNHMGACVARVFSPLDRFNIKPGGRRRIEMVLNPNQIGPGEYTIGISVVGDTPIERINAARRYDLLSRSFTVKVEIQDSLGAVAADFIHTAEWQFSSSEDD